MVIPSLRRRLQSSLPGGGGGGGARSNTFLVATSYESFSDGYVSVWDVTDPEAPELLDQLTGTEASWEELQAVARIGQGIYTGQEPDWIGVRSWDGETLAAVTQVDDAAAGYEEVRHMLTADGRLYFFSRFRNEFWIFEPNGDPPTGVTIVGNIDGGASFFDGIQQPTFSPSGDYVYGHAWDDDILEVVDVQTPASPSRVGTGFDMGLSDVVGCAAAGGYLFLFTASNRTLHSFSIATENSPATTAADTLTDAGFDTANSTLYPVGGGDYLYVAGGSRVSVVDIRDPGAMVYVAGVELPAEIASNGAQCSVDADGYLYVPCGGDNSIQIVDGASDPENPVILGECAHATYLLGSRGCYVWEESA